MPAGNDPDIGPVRFFPGSVRRVTGKTALVTIAMPGGDGKGAEALARLGTPEGLAALNPADLPLPGLERRDWMARLLIGGRGEAAPADAVAALTVAFQLWAGRPVHRARVAGTGPGRFRLALPWIHRLVLREALEMAVAHVAALIHGEEAPGTAERLAAFIARTRPTGLSPNSLRFALAAMARDMPVTVLPGRVLQVGWGANARQFRSSFTDRTPALAEGLSRHKYDCKLRLKQAALPVPEGRMVATPEEARAAAEGLAWPLVVKPVGLDQGAGVRTGIESPEALEEAVRAAAALSPHGVLIEEFVPGEDHRLLIAGGRMVAAARRIPGGVTGDGKSTVRALLDRLNADPRRGTHLRSILKRIPLDEEALSCLDEAGLTPDSIPEAGRFVRLRRIANISTGGTPVDVTGQVHPDNRLAAIRAARVVGLDIAGIDFITPDISRSYREAGGAICEVNGQPAFRPHWLSAPHRDVNGEVLDILFGDRPARIPTAAITGTNGKTTTALMLHHIWQCAGRTAGVCTTPGTWIGRDRVDTQNLSGLPGAWLLFGDPAVEAAIIEMPRLGLIRFGQPCDRYDVAALLNVANDHLGQEGISTLDEMARLKGRVLLRARDAVVVNAADPLCVAVGRAAGAARRILVAEDAAAPAMAAHLAAGGEGIFVGDRDGEAWIMRAGGERHEPFMKVADIPATADGLLRFNVMNAMFAIALADAQGLAPDIIRSALSGFEASREMVPGRYNFIHDLPCRVLVDYAHNEDGFREICRIAKALPVTGRRLLVTRTLSNSGPAKAQDAGADLVETFDHISVAGDLTSIRKYGWYSGEDPLGEMLQTVRDVLTGHGAVEGQLTMGRDHEELALRCLRRAGPEDLVVLLFEPEDARAIIDRFRAECADGKKGGG